ncbi:MAG: hypothetical protein AB1781_09490 [Pseudomonadota bacterium]
MRHRFRQAGRVLGWALIVLALLSLGGALQPWVMGNAFKSLALGELWYQLDAGSLNFLQAIVQRYVHPWLWDYGFLQLLLLPAWVVFGGVGVLLARAFRR